MSACVSSCSSQRRSALLKIAALGFALRGAQVDAAPMPSDPLLRAATPTVRALQAFMLDVTVAGQRLVAVGERGTILLSDDAGQRWRQVVCPVAVSLTAVRFANPNLGWAVGHGGIVLHSADGGSSWMRQLDGRQAAQIELAAAQASGDTGHIKRAEQSVADGADKPLLALHVDEGGRRCLVLGAYGLALATQDGGAHWHSIQDRLDNPRGLHLNAVYAAGSSLYIGAEQGLLLRSSDGGASFSRLRSPYEGSWFALTGLGDELIVAAGLRGNVWWSNDRGASFQQSSMPVQVSISAALSTLDEQLLLVNQAGMLLASSDRGRSFRPLPQPPGPPFTGLAQAVDGSVVASTMSGLRRLAFSVSAPHV